MGAIILAIAACVSIIIKIHRIIYCVGYFGNITVVDILHVHRHRSYCRTVSNRHGARLRSKMFWSSEDAFSVHQHLRSGIWSNGLANCIVLEHLPRMVTFRCQQVAGPSGLLQQL